jgi:cytochrome c peroxidase
MKIPFICIGFLQYFFISSCSNDDSSAYSMLIYIKCQCNIFSGKIDLNKLQNYANQTVPTYITKDNTIGNVLRQRQ